MYNRIKIIRPNEVHRNSVFYLLVHVQRGPIVTVPGWTMRRMSTVGRTVMNFLLLLLVFTPVVFPLLWVALPFLLYVVPFIVICLVICAFIDYARHPTGTGTH